MLLLPAAPPQVEAQTIRVLEVDEVEKMRDIDRAEVIRTGYRVKDGRLVRMDVHWDDGVSANGRDGDEETEASSSGHVSGKSWVLQGRIGKAHQGRRSVDSSPTAPTQAETISAVGFYLHHGFVPTDEPDPALFEEEPDDIHMVLELQKVSASDVGDGSIA
jgi:hypothetical protein